MSASTLTFGGFQTRRPGTYALVDASALAGKQLTVGRLGIVGDFPFLQQNTAKEVTSPLAMSQLDATNEDLQVITRLCFSPSNDERVPGGATAVVLMNAAVTTQASKAVASTGAEDVLLLKSRIWGASGNRMRYVIADGTNEGKKLTIEHNGTSEVHDNVTYGNIFDVNYSGSAFATATMYLDNSSSGNGLVINATRSLGTSTGSHALATPADGKVTITSASISAGDANITCVISGTALVDGVATTGQTETIVFDNTSGTSKTGTKHFTHIATIANTHTNISNAATAAFDVFTAKDSGSTNQSHNFAKISDAVEELNSYTDFAANSISPRVSSLKISELDDFASSGSPTSIKASAQNLTAELTAVNAAFNSSALVSSTVSLEGGRKNVANVAATYLIGGTQTAPTTSGFQTALEKMESQNAQVLAVMSDNATVHGYTVTHCKKMAGLGKSERNAWVGSAASEALSALKTRAKNINSRHVALVAQEPYIANAKGTLTYHAPMYLALQLAAMQCGTPVATPLTRKLPTLSGFRQAASWSPDKNAEELLANGICFLVDTDLTPRVERSVTTYLTDDNAIFSEVSANESVNTSVRDLDGCIGSAAVSGTTALIKELAVSRLKKQVELGYIKAFRNVSIDDLGDTFRVNYEVAATEPINFILIVAHVVRIAAA